MEKKYSACQSCGMPFKEDPKGGGTNADGSISKKYCSHCYQNGKFTQPDITAAEMQAQVVAKLKSLGLFHRIFANYFAKGTPNLERWKQQA